MSSLQVTVTTRRRRRRQRNGTTKVQVRWVLSYRDPKAGKRAQRFFARKEDALAARDRLVLSAAAGVYVGNDKLTVAMAVEQWLEARKGEVKPSALKGYRRYCHYIVGPMPPPDAHKPKLVPDARSDVELLGHRRVSELTTADIRKWVQGIALNVGRPTAGKAKLYLGAALALASEDYGIRPPAMPSGLRNGQRSKKAVLNLGQVAALLRHAQEDPKGIYYAFGFLTGVRPGELLGLVWADCAFDQNLIFIRRAQALNGSLIETKTASSVRTLPMTPLLRRMLLEWQPRCPTLHGKLHRVFPALRGGPLHHSAFLNRVWHPALEAAGMPRVSPHSARHTFISALQHAGCEVAVASRLVGHTNASVTLGVYTHALDDGRRGVEALEGVYDLGPKLLTVDQA